MESSVRGGLRDQAAIAQALPGDPVWFVVEIEQNRMVVLEVARQRTPERWCMARVRHAEIPGIRGEDLSRGAPVQVENGVKAMPVQAVDVAADLRVIRGNTTWRAIDTQPAVLVEGDANSID